MTESGTSPLPAWCCPPPPTLAARTPALLLVHSCIWFRQPTAQELNPKSCQDDGGEDWCRQQQPLLLHCPGWRLPHTGIGHHRRVSMLSVTRGGESEEVICSPFRVLPDGADGRLPSSSTPLLHVAFPQYWKSNPMYWCELCRCWMNDTKAAKLNHERGAKHQENLARSKHQHTHAPQHWRSSSMHRVGQPWAGQNRSSSGSSKECAQLLGSCVHTAVQG